MAPIMSTSHNQYGEPDIPLAQATVLPPPTAPHVSQDRRAGLSKYASGQSFALRTQEIQRLKQQGFTTGLANALTQNNASFSVRIWVVDNSGSMIKGDGHRIVGTKDKVRYVPCTRWTEIQETVEYHAEMASLLQAPTVFRMLNHPGSGCQQQFEVAVRGESYLREDVDIARRTMQNSSPGGVTPLSRHVHEIRAEVESMLPSLMNLGSKVAIILATDGLPTDDRGIGGDFSKREFVEALRSLENLPVWIVVRLCTDEEDVVEFYNDLDNQLELSLEVLDDFVAEAAEVEQVNPWLNYALPLHRCREMGYHHRLFDLLDERQLTRSELRDFCRLLFGDAQFDGVPDPDADWKEFLLAIQRMTKNEEQQWNPIKKKPQPWIDLKTLNKAFGDSSCSIM